MRTKEFCEKYRVTRNEVIYWTQIGILRSRVLENGYNDFGEDAEHDIKRIMIALALDWPGSLADRVRKMDEYDSGKWRKIIEELEEKDDSYSYKLNIARVAANEEMKEGDW